MAVGCRVDQFSRLSLASGLSNYQSQWPTRKPRGRYRLERAEGKATTGSTGSTGLRGPPHYGGKGSRGSPAARWRPVEFGAAHPHSGIALMHSARMGFPTADGPFAPPLPMGGGTTLLERPGGPDHWAHDGGRHRAPGGQSPRCPGLPYPGQTVASSMRCCGVWAFFRLPEPKGRSFGELDILFKNLES